jgi:hypothetical protein
MLANYSHFDLLPFPLPPPHFVASSAAVRRAPFAAAHAGRRDLHVLSKTISCAIENAKDTLRALKALIFSLDRAISHFTRKRVMRGIHISMSLSANVLSAGQGILHNGLPLEKITRNKESLAVLSLITRKNALFCLTLNFLHLPK